LPQQPPPLMTCRQHKHAPNIEEPRQLRLVPKAAKSNIPQPADLRLFFQRSPLFTIPNNQQIGKWPTRSFPHQNLVRLQQIATVLALLQLRRKQNHRPASIQIELLLQLGPTSPPLDTLPLK